LLPGVVVTSNKFIANDVVTGDKFFTSIAENSGQAAIAVTLVINIHLQIWYSGGTGDTDS